MDQHVRVAVMVGLRQRGVEVLTADEDARSRLPDDLLLARATELGRVLFTQDRDFLDVAADWMRSGRAFAGLVYGHQLQVSIGAAVQDLELIAKAADPEDMRNRVYRLPL
jgi:hypothetical protein